jgi:hypothetical protein
MDWKLIFLLSLFGLAMAVATVWVVPSNIEPAFWLVIFLACAYLIASQRASKPFLHGLLLGVVNSVWITASHILFFDAYIARHAQEAAMITSMPLPDSPRLMMALTGPVVGLVSGAVIGVLAMVACKLTKSQPRAMKMGV